MFFLTDLKDINHGTLSVYNLKYHILNLNRFQKSVIL